MNHTGKISHLTKKDMQGKWTLATVQLLNLQLSEQESMNPHTYQYARNCAAKSKLTYTRPEKDPHAIIQRDQVRADELDQENRNKRKTVDDAACQESSDSTYNPA